VLAARAGSLGELLDPLDAGRRAELEALLEAVVGALADDRPTALRICRLCDRDACCADATECPLQHTVTDGDG
jgi:hypothetical protein